MRRHFVFICVITALAFFIIAIILYPGGSILDKHATGFDWSRNFFSNLFLARALNGMENPSRIWALMGMFFNSIGYGLFFLHTAQKIGQKHTRTVLKFVGFANMLFTFLIATPLHDIMVTLSSTLTMIGLFYITVFIFKTKLRWLKVFCIGSLLIFYYTLFLYGAGNWAWLAIMQKATFLCFTVLMLTIEYGMTAKDFLQSKTNRNAITKTDR